MRRAFSLIEVAVASAIAGVIGLAAISAFAVLNQQLVQLQRETVANDVAKSTIDLLVSRLQSVGGGPVRPHMAMWVEDAADGDRDAIFDQLLPTPDDAGRDGADRLTYAQLIPTTPICTIESMDANFVSVRPVSGGCCLRNISSDAFTAYLVNGEFHRQVVLRPPFTDCKAAFAPGPLAPIDSVPAATPANLAGGSIAAVTISTIYLNQQRELRVFEQTSGFPPEKLNLLNGESEVISTDVFDFQVQLGYDVNADGRLVDVNGTGDEWRFNAVNDADVFTTPSSLRMAGVGVIVGVPQVIKNVNTESVMANLPLTRRNFFLRGATGRAAFRNIFLFN